MYECLQILVFGCVVHAVSLTNALTGCSRFVRSTGPVLLDPTVSSDVVSEASSASIEDCLLRCRSRGCVAVSLLQSSRICQLLFINDASQTPGPSGSHVWRSLGSEVGAIVWKSSNIEGVIQMRRLNITIEFRNTSTGRNGSIQQLSINLTGCYRFDAWGAAGGSNSFTGTAGGSGAFMSGSFNLTAGAQLSILVGQAGGPAVDGNSGGGGGGGSFVFVTGDSRPLVAAGGGGGASISRLGFPGQSGENGTDSSTTTGYAGFGGANGNPGFNDPGGTPGNSNHGGCGAGWLGRAVNPRLGTDDGDHGNGPAEGWFGGIAGFGSTGFGGFGGGGGAGGSGSNKKGAGGAGGGFSGGGAGLGLNHAGGGGGSFCGGVGISSVTGGNSGSQQGRVVLQLLASTC